MSVATIATIRVKQGMDAQFEAAFAPLQAAVAANEPGAQVYRLTKVRDQAGVYKVLEINDDDAAVQAHRDSDHFKTLGAALGPFMAGRAELERLDAF